MANSLDLGRISTMGSDGFLIIFAAGLVGGSFAIELLDRSMTGRSITHRFGRVR